MKTLNCYTAGALLLLGITLVGLLTATMPPTLATSLGLSGAEATITEQPEKTDFEKFVGRRESQIKCIEKMYAVTIVQADFLFDDYTFTARGAENPAGGEMMDLTGKSLEDSCQSKELNDGN